MNKPYIQYRDYMSERYGEPLFRVPIDFNTGCPNREADGTGTYEAAEVDDELVADEEEEQKSEEPDDGESLDDRIDE